MDKRKRNTHRERERESRKGEVYRNEGAECNLPFFADLMMGHRTQDSMKILVHEKVQTLPYLPVGSRGEKEREGERERVRARERQRERVKDR